MAAVISIPIVAVIALFGWVFAVLHAESHPRWKRQLPPPKAEVAGGVFAAVDGGRQLMPIWGEPPEIPAQRTAASEESYDTAGAGEAGSQDAGQQPGQQAGERAGIGLPPS